MFYHDGNYEIYVMDADGESQTRLTASPTTAGAGFPFGLQMVSRLAFASFNHDGNSEIYVMDTDGQNQTCLTCYDGSGMVSLLVSGRSSSPLCLTATAIVRFM